MAISFQSTEGSGEDELVSAINTTPLVDVMLVLLIIFLITIPVVSPSVQLNLPKESSIPTITKPENINLAVDRDGQMFWNTEQITSLGVLKERLDTLAHQTPQPEVHIRGDDGVRYEFVGRVIFACQKAGIAKVGFITEPQAPTSY